METEQESERLVLMDRIVRQIDALPPMPETAMKLRSVASNPHVDFSRIVPLVQKDPGLCADLLRFANSASTGVGHPVETVSEAVRYYGMDNLIHFILVSHANRLIRESFGRLKHLDDYFRHADRVSTACALLARQADLVLHDQEVCKVVGLLHNVGKLVLLLATRQWNAPLQGIPWSERKNRIAAEEQHFGLNHCEVGARLCEKWNFPPKLLEAIRYHHRPLRDGQLIPLAAYVYLGELLVIDDLPLEVITRDFAPEHLQALKLSAEDLQRVREDYTSDSPPPPV